MHAVAARFTIDQNISIFEASNLLEDDKNYLIKELEKIKEKSEGENIKKNNTLKKILNYLK